MKYGDTGNVWMDVTNEDSQVPMYDSKIVAKVTRVSWDVGASDSVKDAFSPPGRSAAAQTPAAASQPAMQAAKPAPPPPADALVFDEPPRVIGTSGAPAGAGRAQPPPPKARGGHDDFDMLFS